VTYLESAGIAGNYELATHLERTQFFENTRTYNGGIVWILNFINTLYWNTCTNVSLADTVQPSDPVRRDFTGPDCTGWAYDLTHPTEPYAARGTDPNGGVQRYFAFSQLPANAQNYLNRQVTLSLLNFLDPNLAGFNAFRVRVDGTPIRFNALVRHEPTPFGTDSQLHGFFQRGPLKLEGTLHLYANESNAFPGVSGELWRLPVHVTPRVTPVVSMRGGFWLQPTLQRFDAAGARAGGLLALRVAYPLGALEPYVEAMGKTPGWSPGEVALDAAASVRAGLALSLFR
jgi:hypothetical protein